MSTVCLVIHFHILLKVSLHSFDLFEASLKRGK